MAARCVKSEEDLMKQSSNVIRLLASISVLAFTQSVNAQQPFQFAGAICSTPPVLHCPDKDCSADRVINPGPVVEMKTRRTYFLDYPCDLKPGEKVTFILSLHGAGSYGNWQRHYFPIMSKTGTDLATRVANGGFACPELEF